MKKVMHDGLSVTVLTLLFAVFAAPFCGGGEATAKALFGIDPLPRKTHLRIGFFVGSQHGLANYTAIEKGWFRDANLDVELIPFINGPAMMEAKKSWDVGTAGAPGLISGIIGQDVRMMGLAVWDTILDLMVREDSPIYKSGKGHIPGYPEMWGRPEDWKGTRWLLPAGTSMHLVMWTTLARMGVSERDVTINSMDVTSAYTAFKAGQGDGMGVWTTTAILAAENGFKKVSGITECGSSLATVAFATQEALKGNREAVKKYLDVFLATAHWLDNNREEGTDLYMKTCEEEGIRINRNVAKITLESTFTPTLQKQIAYFENKVPDPMHPTRQMSEMESIIIHTFDFFAAQGRYGEGDRQKILSGYIDPSVMMELKADYEREGRKIW